MLAIQFSSTLGRQYKNDLEQLLFFNPQQYDVQAGIVESIARYGQPRIVIEEERLRVCVAGLPEVQTLFALTEPARELIGAMVYVRSDRETLVLLHVGIKEDFTLAGERAEAMVLVQLLAKLREIARRLKGVEAIMLMYGRNRDQRLPIHRDN